MTVKYRWQHCGNISTLRNPALMNPGLPLAVAAFALDVRHYGRWPAASRISFAITSG
jgi:hypothetical protein